MEKYSYEEDPNQDYYDIERKDWKSHKETKMKDILNEVKEMVVAVCGPNHPYEIEFHDDDGWDPTIIINHCAAICWERGEKNPDYTACEITYDPGVMYHSDGSGTPPSEDYIEIGTSKNLSEQVLKALQIAMQNEMDCFLESKDDLETTEENEYERNSKI